MSNEEQEWLLNILIIIYMGCIFVMGYVYSFDAVVFFREHENFFSAQGVSAGISFLAFLLCFVNNFFHFFSTRQGVFFLVKDLLASLGLWRESFPFSEDVQFASAPTVDLSLRSFHEQSLFLSVLDFRQLIRQNYFLKMDAKLIFYIYRRTDCWVRV